MKSSGAIGLFLFTVIAVAVFFWMTARPAMGIASVQFGMPVNDVVMGEEKVDQKQQTTPEKEETALESQEVLDSVDSATNSIQ